MFHLAQCTGNGKRHEIPDDERMPLDEADKSEDLTSRQKSYIQKRNDLLVTESRSDVSIDQYQQQGIRQTRGSCTTSYDRISIGILASSAPE